MERREELEILEKRMTETWHRMCSARNREDWASYWRLRKSWLSFGRMHSILIERDQEERRAQLSLLDHRVGRAHDQQAG